MGLGGLVGSGSLAVGSGAFTTVEAERRINIETADDDLSGYLNIDITEGENAAYSGIDNQDGTLELIFTDDTERIDEGMGLNPGAVTEFDEVFSIRNDGSQNIEFWAEDKTDDAPTVELYAESGTLTENDGAELDTGESTDIGVRIITDNTGSFDKTLTLRAEAT